MDLGLQGRLAIVTGGSKGIGLAIVRALSAEGVTVVTAARTISAELAELTATAQVTVMRLDLADPASPARLVAAAGERIDILVNNAGAAPVHPDGFLSGTDQDWLDSLNLNLLAAVRTTRAALPAMLAASRGVIITVSSVTASYPLPDMIEYSAAKAALSAFMKALSKEVGPKGIRVNTVSPGPTSTPMWLGESGIAVTTARAAGVQPEDVVKQTAQLAVTGRFTEPGEVADLVAMLASDRTANLTGADIAINGGIVPTW